MKYIVLIKRAEVGGQSQDPTIGVLYLADGAANALIADGKAVDVTSEIGPVEEE